MLTWGGGVPAHQHCTTCPLMKAALSILRQQTEPAISIQERSPPLLRTRVGPYVVYETILTYLLTELPIVQPFRKFPAILRNPKVHHRVHKSPSLVPILSQFDPVHTIPTYLSKIQFNIVYPPTSWFSSGLFPSDFRTNILYSFLVSPIRATCPAHLILIVGTDCSKTSHKQDNMC
jgi:hypothetical protein